MITFYNQGVEGRDYSRLIADTRTSYDGKRHIFFRVEILESRRGGDVELDHESLAYLRDQINEVIKDWRSPVVEEPPFEGAL